jgi:erythromycin esterase-like protein
MRRRMLALLGALALVGAAPAAAPVAAHTAHVSCKQATIGGQSKCIARGQFCAHRYRSDYRRYGFSCSSRDHNGRYHLR